MQNEMPQFSSKIRRVVINGEVHFSVHDVFALYSNVNNARRDWTRVQKRLEEQGFDGVSTLTRYRFTDSLGRHGQATPIATLNTFLRIAQVANFKDWEYIRQFMVDAAEEKIEAAAGLTESREYRKLLAEGFSPQEARQWLERRASGIETRKWITGVWRKRGARGKDFAILTNQISEIVHGKSATQRKQEMGLTKHDTVRNYDAATDQVLTAIAEMTSGSLHEWRDSLGYDQLAEDVGDVKPIIDGARPGVLAAFSKKPRPLPSGQSELSS